MSLDIGSVCDAWMGVPSHPLVLQSLFGGPQVPPFLRLSLQARHPSEADPG